MSSSSDLGKGGKPKVQHDKAKAAALELMASRLAQLRRSAEEYPQRAYVVLSIDGLGYKDNDGTFTTKKPSMLKGRAGSYHGDFREQFWITVGTGEGFSQRTLVCISNPVFFKDGDTSSKKSKLVGGHDPIVNVGDYVFLEQAAGLACYETGAGRGCLESRPEVYSDLYAVLPKKEAREWIKAGLLRMV